MSLCQFFLPPSEQEQNTFKINDPDIVFGCENEQGDAAVVLLSPSTAARSGLAYAQSTVPTWNACMAGRKRDRRGADG